MLVEKARVVYRQVQSAGLTSSAAQCLELTSVPVGIAMWRKMAQALGWPSKPISFKQLIDLAQDPDGWYAHLATYTASPIIPSPIILISTTVTRAASHHVAGAPVLAEHG
jgi:hypothetical protein